MSTEDSVRLARVRALRDELTGGSATMRGFAEWLTEALEDEVALTPVTDLSDGDVVLIPAVVRGHYGTGTIIDVQRPEGWNGPPVETLYNSPLVYVVKEDEQ